MTYKILVPFMLLTIIWSGYVMFDFYEYYSVNPTSGYIILDTLFSFAAFLIIPGFSYLTLKFWNELE